MGYNIESSGWLLREELLHGKSTSSQTNNKICWEPRRLFGGTRYCRDAQESEKVEFCIRYYIRTLEGTLFSLEVNNKLKVGKSRLSYREAFNR